MPKFPLSEALAHLFAFSAILALPVSLGIGLLYGAKSGFTTLACFYGVAGFLAIAATFLEEQGW